MRAYFIILSLFFCGISFAQNTITGTVTDAAKNPIAGAKVSLSGGEKSTNTGFDGKFMFKNQDVFPVTIDVTMMGFISKTYEITTKEQEVIVVLVEDVATTSLNEIVVAASRAPERVLETPVTIERLGLKQIKNTTAASVYEGLENLKDVHFNTSSINFKSVNTRGFATVANTRFMQLVDGMDNTSPALNFVIGNLVGLTDNDIASIEILPGASSALYGANAFNGIMFINSRSPFVKEGISTYLKYGQTSSAAGGSNAFYDFGLRVAKKFSNQFAVKGNFSYVQASEWIASDDRNVSSGIIDNGLIGHAKNQNYDGVNTYGDEVSTFLTNVGQVSRTGYRDQDLIDNKAVNTKADFSLHYKPFSNDIEFILQHKLGFGNTIYQGANRYALKDFYMDQTRFEVKGKNFFARVYRTSEDAGNSYDTRFAAINVNRLAKSDTNWFTDYAKAFQLSSAMFGYDANTAAGYARNFADNNLAPGMPFLTPNTDPLNPSAPRGARFAAGSPEFNSALASVITNPNLKEGAKFQDKSKIYHADLNYNFKNEIKFAEIQVGGSAREFVLNSKGSIFTDYDGPIHYNELGVYTQGVKKFMNDRLKVTASIRYDKSKNFKGSYSPRISFTYGAGAKKQHNFRVSYQTGFRNPTTQDQYIGLDLGQTALIGSAPENLDRYVETRNISAAGQLAGQAATRVLTGRDAYFNAYTAESFKIYQDAVKAGSSPTDASKSLVVASPTLVNAEEVKAFELGYRTLIRDFSVDINGYYNVYNNFISNSNTITPLYGALGSPLSVTALQNNDVRKFQVYTNSKAQVTSLGLGLGLSRKIFKNFEITGSYNYSQFSFDQSTDPSFEPSFNTPKHRAKAGLGNDKLFKNFGFNTNVRWNSEYQWQSTFIDGIVEENVVFDAQLSYGIRALGSVIKLGATNIGGKDYIQVIGAGSIGRQFYATWTINP